tara:strand:+ start:1275 stop:1946 length:672 start_codon:yes stop_codon:yes gene_type:complete
MDNLIEVPTTRRYSTLGCRSKNIKAVWFVFHGYGMRSDTFIQEFDCINDEQTLVVAPEGMHRYYGKGTNGAVRANWMTSDLREYDIVNNIEFLNCVIQDLYDKGISNDVQFGVLGFSQGAPTAFRWVSQLKVEIGCLVAWGSDIPKDVYLDNIKRLKINQSKIKLVIGSSDEYISSEKVDDYIMEMHEQGVEFDFHTFEGGHNLHAETIRYFHARLMDDGLEY